jgi:alanine dehydrogenase
MIITAWRFFGGDVLVPAESASGLLTGDLVRHLRDHCVVRDRMIDLGDLVHGVAFDEQLILAE